MDELRLQKPQMQMVSRLLSWILLLEPLAQHPSLLLVLLAPLIADGAADEGAGVVAEDMVYRECLPAPCPKLTRTKLPLLLLLPAHQLPPPIHAAAVKDGLLLCLERHILLQPRSKRAQPPRHPQHP